MVQIALFLFNLILMMGFIYSAFRWDIGGDVIFIFLASMSAVMSFVYPPLLRMLKQGEFGYVNGFCSLLFIVGLSQILGMLVYAIAAKSFVYRDTTALIIFGSEFATCLVILAVLYTTSYWLCRVLWK